jgi:hypothetical protein
VLVLLGIDEDAPHPTRSSTRREHYPCPTTTAS